VNDDGTDQGPTSTDPPKDGAATEGLTQDDVRDTQRFVILLGRLGLELSAAIHDAVGADLASNAAVVTLSLLDLEGPKRPGELQLATGLSSGGVSKLLDRMEGQDLIARKIGSIPEDRRGVIVSITAEGRLAAERIAGAIRGRFDELRVFVKEFSALAEG
jgi:DNA-binding MarR family transcriptional regulator